MNHLDLTFIFTLNWLRIFPIVLFINKFYALTLIETIVDNLPNSLLTVVIFIVTFYLFDIFRGGSTWKPSVVPTGSHPTPSQNINNISPVTRTSLSAKQSENIGAIGTGHNLSAKPFSPQVCSVFWYLQSNDLKEIRS